MTKRFKHSYSHLWKCSALLLSLMAAGVSVGNEKAKASHVSQPSNPMINTRESTVNTQAQSKTNNVHDVKVLVRPGETIQSIASQYDSTVSGIERANHLSTPSVYPGEELIVPEGLADASANSTSKVHLVTGHHATGHSASANNHSNHNSRVSPSLKSWAKGVSLNYHPFGTSHVTSTNPMLKNTSATKGIASDHPADASVLKEMAGEKIAHDAPKANRKNNPIHFSDTTSAPRYNQSKAKRTNVRIASPKLEHKNTVIRNVANRNAKRNFRVAKRNAIVNANNNVNNGAGDSLNNNADNSVNNQNSSQEAKARNWIVHNESRGEYNVWNRSHQNYGKYQLNYHYLHNNYTPKNQDTTANNYVHNRYKSWVNAKSFWERHGWY